MCSDSDVPDQRLELPLRAPVRPGGRPQLPGEAAAGWCHLSFSLFTDDGIWLLVTRRRLRSGEAEPTRGAAERPEAHPLLLLQHRLLPAASPGPEGGDQPSL